MFLITFPAVWKWLMGQIVPTKYKNETDLFQRIFRGYLEEIGIDYTDSRFGQFKSGAEPVPLKMVKAYWMEQKYMDTLAEAIGEEILPVFINQKETLEQLHLAIELDEGLLTQWKEDLLNSYETDDKERICQWLAMVLRCAISPRENPQAKKSLRLVSIGYIPRPCGWFVGRDKEKDTIGDLLKERKNVFLHGIAGIGKSELAKKYVDEHGKAYNAILWISCKESLRQSIAEVKTALDKPEEDEQTRFRHHLERLQMLLEDSLLILDNCSCLPEEEPLLDEILRYRCHVLITTRTYMEDRVNLEVRELEEDQLLDMMNSFRKGLEAPEQDMKKLIRMLHKHTFAVELAARLTRKNTPAPGKLCWMLKKDRFLRGLLKKRVRFSKDDGKPKGSYYEAMHALFALTELDSEKQWLMTNMTLMPERGVYQHNLVNLLDLPDDEQVDNLAEMGFLRWDEESAVIQMLPMMREITLVDCPPSIGKCKTLVNTIAEQCENYGADYHHYALLYEIVDQIILNADKEDALDLYWTLLCNAFNYMEKVEWHSAMRRVFREIERIENEAHLSPHCSAEYLDMKACFEGNCNQKVVLEERALALLEETGEGDCPLAKNIRNNLGGAKRMAKCYDAAIDLLEERLNQLITDKNRPERYDYITCAANLAVCYSEAGQFEKALALLKTMEQELRDLGQTYASEYGKVLETLGTVHLEQGLLWVAKSYYWDAMLVWEERYNDMPELIHQKAEEYKQNCIAFLLGAKPHPSEQLQECERLL